MYADAWTLNAWLPVSMNLLDWRRLAERMRVLDDPNRAEYAGPLPRAGVSLWGAPVSGAMVGLSWRWVELRKNVFVLEDPMQVCSNVLLVEERGEPMSNDTRLLHLNNTLYTLAWQAPLQRPDPVADRILAA